MIAENMNSTYNKKLAENAKTLRRNMTKEERHLWYDFLRKLPIMVHRQKTIGNYIVDFFVAEAKMVIELDGSQHFETKGMQEDLVRDTYLKSLGLSILRYSNADINLRFGSVCEDIWNRLQNFEKKPSP